MESSIHFLAMLRERGIRREWVTLAEQEPDRVEDYEDGTRHFIKRIEENENRWLRVVVNVKEMAEIRVTAFFDRRLRRQDEDRRR